MKPCTRRERIFRAGELSLLKQYVTAEEEKIAEESTTQPGCEK